MFLGGVYHLSILPERLKQARERKNFKQTQVMNRTGINNKTLSGYENGVSEPDGETLKVLAELYEVSTDWLLGRSDEKLSKNRTEFVIREIVEKYHVNLEEPGAKEKLEQIIQLVFQKKN